MPRRIKYVITDEEIEREFQEIWRMADEMERDNRRWVTHSCGHKYRYPGEMTDEWREDLAKVDCPTCQRMGVKHTGKELAK